MTFAVNMNLIKTSFAGDLRKYSLRWPLRILSLGDLWEYRIWWPLRIPSPVTSENTFLSDLCEYLLKGPLWIPSQVTSVNTFSMTSENTFSSDLWEYRLLVTSENTVYWWPLRILSSVTSVNAVSRWHLFTPVWARMHSRLPVSHDQEYKESPPPPTV